MRTHNATAGSFRKLPVEIEAAQWRKNGDHPQDDAAEMFDYPNGSRPHVIREGAVVRYYRHPEGASETACKHCGVQMHDHGWIDTLEGGHIVCPGDWNHHRRSGRDVSVQAGHIRRDLRGGEVSAPVWAWWAGRNEEEFTLAGPCLTREQAIDEAYGETDPGDVIHLVEAIVSEEVDSFTDLYPFVEQRNASQVIRDEDAEPALATPATSA